MAAEDQELARESGATPAGFADLLGIGASRVVRRQVLDEEVGVIY
jgi:hypothetical protein